MVTFHSVMTLCIPLLTLVNICIAQNITTTAEPTKEEGGFYSASTIEILILVGVIIGCPIFICILCKWQRNKTEKFTKSRQEQLDKITAGAMQRQEVQMVQANQKAAGQRGGFMMQTNGVPMHNQSPSQQPMIAHGEMQERSMQNPAAPINASNAKPIALIDAPSTPEAQPPPPAGPAPKDFDRRRTEQPRSKAMNTSKDAQRQKSNSVLHKKANGKFSSQGVPAPPSGPPPASPPPDKKDKDKSAPPSYNDHVKKKENRDYALDMLIQSPSAEHQPPPAWTNPAIKNKKKAPTFMKVQSVSGVGKVDMESALVLPDVLDDAGDEEPPEVIPRTKTFDAKTGAPIELELEVDDGNKKNRERIKTEDIERSLSIPDKDDNKDDNDGNISDSSSGEPLDMNDKNLLQIAHEQMESKPPPSLQTIFGRNVMNKDDDSESEDSLLKRQQAFEQGKEDMGPSSPPDKPESTFVLNV
eukprot:CAMPEP_0201575878 /NCGR_PEP_ID=MMETSP0190_2-20130828/21323_1 /ASSEMBLY_ACC=CAM_ASM_000263 /TAXON_ID=37353 /ORGANISM="Rosalina sp." /LENGTH=470 /DNA_ID=CAMNT_0048006051 /DNA_START=27 /DNA_END=1439 /DNA_ORIENTATION=+